MESCSFSAILEGQCSCCLQYVWFLTTLESDFTASIICICFGSHEKKGLRKSICGGVVGNY